ncbi:MAG: class A beta-lactamase-related serine hydrolase [Chloroflexota bacterium]|nr:class A beta-lactamase-related serine hydrolase [Chloroflexota bacterium]
MGGIGLNRRNDPRRRYRRAGDGQRRARKTLLTLVLVGFVVSVIVWRASPSAPLLGQPTATPTSTDQRATTATRGAAGIALPRDSATVPPRFGLAQALGPTIDRAITQYQPQGITGVGLVIVDGRPEDIIERNADDRFAAGSLYKLFLLWRTQVEIRQHKLFDTTQLMLTAQNDDAEEDGYALGAYGDTVSVSDLRRLMITASNNTAAQVLGQYFGWGTVDQLLRAHGFTATVVTGPARTTPREVARFLDGLVNRTLDPLLTPDDYTLMIGLLKEQQVNTKLSTGFPDGTVFAHKTGDVPGAHHDAGIIFLPDGRAISIIVMTSGDYDASVQLQHDLAALLWNGLSLVPG